MCVVCIWHTIERANFTPSQCVHTLYKCGSQLGGGNGGMWRQNKALKQKSVALMLFTFSFDPGKQTNVER